MYHFLTVLVCLAIIIHPGRIPSSFAQGLGLGKLIEVQKPAEESAKQEEESITPPEEELSALQDQLTKASVAYETTQKELTPRLNELKAQIQQLTKNLSQASSPEVKKQLEEELRLLRDQERVVEQQLNLADEERALAEQRLRFAEQRMAFPTEQKQIEESLKTKTFTPQDARIATEEAKIAEEKVSLAQGKIQTLQGEILSLEKEIAQMKLALAKAEQESEDLATKVASVQDNLKKEQLVNQAQKAQQRVELLRQRIGLATRQLELTQGKLNLATQEMDLAKAHATLLSTRAQTIRQAVGISEEELKTEQEKAAAMQKVVETEKQKAQQEQAKAQQERAKAQQALEEAKMAKERATTKTQARLAEIQQQLAKRKAELAEQKAELARAKIALAEKAAEIAQKQVEITSRKIEVERKKVSATDILSTYELAKAEATRAAQEVSSMQTRVTLAKQEVEALRREAELAQLKVQVEQEQLTQTSPEASVSREIVRALEEIARLAQERVKVAEEHLGILQEQARLAAEKAQVTRELEQLLAVQRVTAHLWEREPSKISWTILEEVSADLVNLRSTAIIWMADLPEQLNLLKDYLLEPTRFRRIVRQGALVIGLFLFTFVCVIFLRRRLRQIIAKQERLFLPSTSQKILRACTRIFYQTIFRALFLVTGIVVFLLVTIGKKIWLAVVIFLAGLTVYRFSKSVIQELFMPWDAQQRLINCRDSVASYIYRHLLRIIIFGTTLPTFILILEALEYREGVIALLWLIFRLGFLVLLILLTYNKEAMVSLLPQAENRLEKFIYVTATKVYPLFILFIICVVALQSLGYVTLARFLVRSLLLTGVILAVARLTYKGLDRLFYWWLLSAGRQERDFLLSRDTAETLYDLLSYGVSYLVYIMAFFVIAGIWGIDLSGISAVLTSETSRDYFWRIVAALLVIAISTGVLRAIYYVIEKIFILPPEEARAWRKKISLGDKGKTIAPLLKNLARYLTIFVAGVLVLRKLGVDPTPIIAGAGVIGLAVGFGAQTLIRDVISGFFLLFEGLIAVGDVVNFGSTAGLVEEVGLRVTKYRAFSGELQVIPNGEIRTFGNFNRQWMRAVVAVDVAYEQDVRRAMKVLEEVGRTWAAERTDIVLEPPEVQGIMSFNDSSITIRLVIKVKPMQHWAAERELALRIKEAFDREGVEIPFPRRVVYTRQEKNGTQTQPQDLILLAEQAHKEGGAN